MTRTELFENGRELLRVFCDLNTLPVPGVEECGLEHWQVTPCAYYRPSTIHICVSRCAPVGYGGRAWSFPGYVVDRTPYGVVQHELGHHADVLNSTRKGNYYGDFSMRLHEQTGEKAITTYCPNDAEWFAEIFRLFVTNPDLLRLLRPRVWKELRSKFSPVFEDSWRERLTNAPERTLKAAERKIDEVRE